FGFLTPVAGALTQEAIDVAVILNALRALTPGRRNGRAALAASAAQALHQDHQDLVAGLDRLREIADALDDSNASDAVRLIAEANTIVEQKIAEHERADERVVYPHLSNILH